MRLARIDATSIVTTLFFLFSSTSTFRRVIPCLIAASKSLRLSCFAAAALSLALSLEAAEIFDSEVDAVVDMEDEDGEWEGGEATGGGGGGTCGMTCRIEGGGGGTIGM